MAVLRLFASAREAAGVSVDRIEAQTVGDVLDEACRRYGDEFGAILGHSRVWVNGQPADRHTVLREGDVVAVLPPVSGGAAEVAATAAADTAAITAPEPPRRSAPEPAPTASWFRPPETALAFTEGSLARAPKPVAPKPVAPKPERPPEPTPPPTLPEQLPALAVVPDTDRPHVRLGLLWAVATIVFVAAGRPFLAVWMATLAGIAAVQVTKAWMARGERPVSWLAVAGAATLPLAAIGGLDTLTMLLVATFVLVLLARVNTMTTAPSRDVALTMLIVLPIGIAAASPVLLRGLGVAPVLSLLAFAAFHDVGAYLVGTGATAWWEGPVAGVASIVCVTLFVAVLVPDFKGGSPFLLGVLAAVLTPLGPLAASVVLGDRDTPAPALRRLDSLLLLGPVWAWSAAVVLHR